MAAQLRNKKVVVDSDGAATATLLVPAGTQVGDLMIALVIGPPGQPNDPWVAPAGWNNISVANPAPTPSTSPMVLHSGEWWRIATQTDLDTGSFVFTAPDQPTGATRFVAYLYSYYGHDPVTPVESPVGWPHSEDGGNPAGGQNGNPVNPNCDTIGEGCPTFQTPDMTATVAGCLVFAMALSHEDAFPFGPPSGYQIIDNFTLPSSGADISFIVATKVVFSSGPIDGPEFTPAATGWDNAASRAFLIRPGEVPPESDELPELYVADGDEGEPYTTKAQDLMDGEGGNNGLSVIDWPGAGLDVGSTVPALHVITAQGWDTTVYGGRTRGPVEMNFRLFARQSSFESLRSSYRELQNHLDRRGVLVFHPPGVTDPTYFDYLPGSAASLLGGQERPMFRSLTLHHGEVLVRMMRQPWSRRPTLDSHVTADEMSNYYNEHHVVVHNPGTAESPLIVAVYPHNALTKLVRVWIGRRSRGNLTEYIKNERGFIAWDAERAGNTLYNGSTVETAATASNGQVVRFDFNTDIANWMRVVRFEAVPEDPNALAGTYRVMLIARQDPDQIVRYQYRWGLAAGQDPLPAANPYREINSTSMTQSKFRIVDLGEVTFDTNGNALCQEIWLYAVDSRSANALVDLDQVVMLPADEQLVTLAEPSFLSPPATDVWDAAGLIAVVHGNKPSTTAADDATLVEPPLNDLATQRTMGNAESVGGAVDNPDVTDEGIGTPLLTLAEGQHRFFFRGTVQQNSGVAGKVGELRVRRLASGTWTDYAKADIRSKAGQQYTHFDYDKPDKVVVVFDVTDDTHTFQGQVVMTADRQPADDTPPLVAATRKIAVRGIDHSGMVTTTTPNAMVLDGRYPPKAFVRDANGAQLRPLEGSGPLTAVMGDQVYVCLYEEAPVVGMDQGSLDGPAGIVESTVRYTNVFSIEPHDMTD